MAGPPKVKPPVASEVCHGYVEAVTLAGVRHRFGYEAAHRLPLLESRPQWRRDEALYRAHCLYSDAMGVKRPPPPPPPAEYIREGAKPPRPTPPPLRSIAEPGARPTREPFPKPDRYHEGGAPRLLRRPWEGVTRRNPDRWILRVWGLLAIPSAALFWWLLLTALR